MANFFDQFDNPNKVAPVTQKSRDTDALQILKTERNKKMSDSDRDALEREIQVLSKKIGVEYQRPTSASPQVEIPKAKTATPAKETNYLPAFTRSVNKGYTYGYSAETEAAARAAAGAPYEPTLKALKGEERALTEQHPIVSGVGETLGMLLNPLSYLGAAYAAKAPRGVQILANAANQAAIGGAEGFSKNYDTQEAALGATVGGVFSLVGDSAANIIQKVGDKEARKLVHDKLAELLKTKPPGYDKTLRKVFNAGDNVSEEQLVKHANDYAYKIKNEGASLVEPAPIVNISKADAAAEQQRKIAERKAKNEAAVKAHKAEMDKRRAAARAAYEERTGAKVESTAQTSPEVQTPKQTMDERDGAVFTALQDPAKYDQLRRERMYEDIAKLTPEERKSVEVIDKLAQKHGFEDHIDWARFNQGIPKQEPLRPQGGTGTQGPEGAMGMVEIGGKKFVDEDAAMDAVFNKIKRDLPSAQPEMRELRRNLALSRDFEAAAQKHGFKDYGEFIENDVGNASNKLRELLNTLPYGHKDEVTDKLLGKLGKDFKSFADRVKESGKTDDELLSEALSIYRRIPDESRFYQKMTAPVKEATVLKKASTGSAPPNTMAMASRPPIDKSVDPPFYPEDVSPGAFEPKDASAGAKAFGTLGETVTGTPPVPPTPPVFGANAKSVLDNLAPNRGAEILSTAVKSAGGALGGYAVHKTLPEEWQDSTSWLLPLLGAGFGVPNAATATRNVFTHGAINRAVSQRPGLTRPVYPDMYLGVSTVRNVANQAIPVDAPSNNYFDQFDEKPKRGLSALLDRVNSEWRPIAGE